MAEGITAQDRQMSSSVISKNISTGTIDMITCYKIGNIVTVGARIHTITNEHAGEKTWFIIPEGYRPRTNTRGSAYIMTDDGGHYAILCTISASGEVIAFITSSKQATQIGFCATYPI